MGHRKRHIEDEGGIGGNGKGEGCEVAPGDVAEEVL